MSPNYEAAALWYQKAADQKYSRAQFNLGTLYEQGLGVPADKLKALDLYRASMGMPADSIMYQSAAREEQEALRAELQKTIDEQDTQIKALESQIAQLQNQVRQGAGTSAGQCNSSGRRSRERRGRGAEQAGR